ncbi:MAG: hypothetical protein C0169_00120 [Thermodesulfobacterium geofontis]|uniref:Chromosome segregation and condensation protein ScpA n=1 Tax=Thermodesulfobacterium geofontis TaxID=1295609 RepID=A0A2N7QGU3_9BACT|nr:MAG: hypothetical protein C0169_00120 [Thermodesulfobacterium geofontis]
MYALETPVEFYKELEELKGKISKNRIELIDLNLTKIVLSLQRYLPLVKFNEIFLEFLIKLSEAIYLKSCLLLNINVHNGNKEEIEDLKEIPFEKSLKEKPNYYKALSLERILFEKIFLGRISDFPEKSDIKNFKGEGEKSLILRAILSILNQEEIKEEMLKNFSALSIEFYLENLKKYLEEKLSFTFKGLIEEKLEKERNFLEIVYYFLALLFLYLEGLCYMIQNSENEDIIIFSRNVYNKKIG